MPAQPKDARRLAAVDVGTNSIRLVVAEFRADGTYQILDQEKRTTRLGKGLAAAGRLDPDALERALDAVGTMQAIARGHEVEHLAVVATSAVRDADNGRDFVRRARQRFGLDVQVISGGEEGRYAFLSAARNIPLDGRPATVVDIGGGSTEVVLAAGTVIDGIYSLPLGAMGLTEALVGTDPLPKRDWKTLCKEVDRRIRERIGKPPFTAETMVGSGGTFTNLAAMVQHQRDGKGGKIQGSRFTPADVVHLLHRLRELDQEGRARVPGLSPDRADIIVAGVTIVARLAKHLGTREIVVNDGGIREGLLISLAGIDPLASEGGTQARERMDWIRIFARQCRSDERHCEQVAALALALFDQLGEREVLTDEARDILQAAALLHEVGYLISHSKHHKHAYHIIRHADIPGWSGQQVEVIANVARYHRRAFPKKKHENFRRLDPDARRLVETLSGILRIADGLDRTHTQAVQSIQVAADDETVRVTVRSECLPQVEIWDAKRKSELFELFNERPVEIDWKKARRAARASSH